MLFSEINPVVVRVVEAPTQETSVADILLGALGLVGVVLVAALLAGLVAGWLFYLFRKSQGRRRGDDRPPTISPSALPR